MREGNRVPPVDRMSGREEENAMFDLEVDGSLEGFKTVEVTKIDESKPWKPALEVKVTQADGTVTEAVDANRPVYTFKDGKGRTLRVSIATAGHIDDMHIHAKEPGSKFEQNSLTELMRDVAAHLPDNVMDRQGIATFDMEMEKQMGLEGIASMDELLREGVIAESDVNTAKGEQARVFELNRAGSLEEKKEFIEEFKAAHPESKIQFQLVRDTVLVPVVASAKRPTTKLFMMMGPGRRRNTSGVYRCAGSRYAPSSKSRTAHGSRRKF